MRTVEVRFDVRAAVVVLQRLKNLVPPLAPQTNPAPLTGGEPVSRAPSNKPPRFPWLRLRVARLLRPLQRRGLDPAEAEVLLRLIRASSSGRTLPLTGSEMGTLLNAEEKLHAMTLQRASRPAWIATMERHAIPPPDRQRSETPTRPMASGAWGTSKQPPNSAPRSAAPDSLGEHEP